MKLRTIFKIQELLDERKTPYDMDEFLEEGDDGDNDRACGNDWNDCDHDRGRHG